MADNINQPDKQGDTPLLRAIGQTDGEEAALTLLKAGADPNKVDEMGNAALHLALAHEYNSLIPALLKHGAEIDQANNEGATPLMVAAFLPDSEEAALLLLKAGADPRIVDQGNRSALHLAAGSGHIALITALLERGVDFEQADNAGMTPLMVAARSLSGEEAALTLLEARADPKKLDHNDDSALHLACRSGHTAVFNALLEQGVEIDQEGQWGETPLIDAADSLNGEEMALALLKAGADPTKVDQNNVSALHLAAHSGHTALVTALLERGVDIDQANREGETPLMFAACSPNREEAALTLLEAGADPKKVSQDGYSALHLAFRRGYTAVVIALLERGVDIEQANNAGATPLMLAARSESGQEAALALLKAGADAKKVDGDGNSALHLACRNGYTAVVSALLEQGVDLEQTNSAGMTPLMLAAQSEIGEEMALALLKAGADPTKTDNEGRSAAYFAEKQGHIELL